MVRFVKRKHMTAREALVPVHLAGCGWGGVPEYSAEAMRMAYSHRRSQSCPDERASPGTFPGQRGSVGSSAASAQAGQRKGARQTIPTAGGSGRHGVAIAPRVMTGLPPLPPPLEPVIV